MDEKFSRIEALIGEKALNKLSGASVLLLGVGGVGGYVFESLVRSGIGKITVADGDTVAESNFNRQIIATESALGKLKAEVAAERARSINPLVSVTTINEFLTAESVEKLDFSQFDYVIDAIDTVTTKVAVARKCIAENVRAISCMGTGNKLEPQLLRVARLKDTHDCPLCKAMRRLLREVPGGGDLKVVFSPETPRVRRRPPASMIFCPAVAGLYIAAEVVKDIAVDENPTV